MSDYNDICYLYTENVDEEVRVFTSWFRDKLETLVEDEGEYGTHKKTNDAVTKQYKIHLTAVEQLKNICISKIDEIHQKATEPFTSEHKNTIKIAEKEYNDIVKAAKVIRDGVIHTANTTLKNKTSQCEFDKKYFINITQHNDLIIRNTLKHLYKGNRSAINKSKIDGNHTAKIETAYNYDLTY